MRRGTHRDRRDSNAATRAYPAVGPLAGFLATTLTLGGVGGLEGLGDDILCAVDDFLGGNKKSCQDDTQGQQKQQKPDQQNNQQPDAKNGNNRMLVPMPVGAQNFPGSTAVTTSDVEGRSKGPAEVQAVVEATKVTGRSEPEPKLKKKQDGTYQLRRMTQLSVTYEAATAAGVEVEAGDNGVEASWGGGTNVKYQVTVPPQRADQITTNKGVAPNPYVPHKMSKGAQTLMRWSQFRHTETAAQLDNLRVRSKVSDGASMSSMVQRVDEKHMRVVVGDSDYVDQLFRVGLGEDFEYKGVEGTAFVGLQNDKKLRSGKASTMTFDIAQQQGWNAYLHFLLYGKLPPESAGTKPWISEVATLQTVSASDQTKAVGEITVVAQNKEYALQVQMPVGQKQSARYQVRQAADGSVKSTARVDYGRVAWSANKETDKNGNSKPPSYTMLLSDVSGSIAKRYVIAANGGNVPGNYDKNRDIALEYTKSDLMGLRDRARRYVREQCGDLDRSSPCSNPNPHIRELTRIAGAENPLKVLNNLVEGQGWSNNTLSTIANRAMFMSDRTGMPNSTWLPGRIVLNQPRG